jgi:hypothetical protein
MLSRKSCAISGLSMLLFVVLSSLACGHHSTKPTGCYSVDELYPGGAAATDSTTARTVFQAYLVHLDESGGYPVFRWSQLEYVRSSGREDYNGSTYWGIVARGRQQGVESAETTQFRVRQDGVVVQMLGCI